jgi:hypothetical protein
MKIIIDVSVHGSILSPPPTLLAAQAHMDAYHKIYIAATRIQACAKMFSKKGKKGGELSTPTRTNRVQDNTKDQGQQGKILVGPPTMDQPTLTRVSEPAVFTQPPDIIVYLFQL